MNTPPKIPEAIALSDQGKHEEAIELLNEIIEEYPKHWRAYNCRAICKSYLQDNDGAFEDYNKALSLDPNNPKVLANIGGLFGTEKKFEKAIDYYSMAIEQNFDDALYKFRGDNYFNLKMYSEAIEDHKRFLEYDDSFTDIYYKIGVSYKLLGDNQNAKHYFDLAIKKDPGSKYSQRLKEYLDAPIAKKTDWITKPMKIKSISEVGVGVSAMKYEIIKKGYIPKDENDKWFTYFENETLFCHRASDGQCIFEVLFIEEYDEYVSKELYVEGDPQIFNIEPGAELFFLMFLIHCGISYHESDDQLKRALFSGLLEYASFDELEEMFGRILQ